MSLAICPTPWARLACAAGAAVTLGGCVTYTSAPPKPAAVAALKTVAVVVAQPPRQLILMPRPKAREGGAADPGADRMPAPNVPFAREAGAAMAFVALSQAVAEWRTASAELSEKLVASEVGIAGAWNEALVQALRAKGFDVIELPAEAAPRWPHQCPTVTAPVDAVVGVELSAGFTSANSLKPMVGAGVRVTSRDCGRTLFSPMYFYGFGTPEQERSLPAMFLPSDPDAEFRDRQELLDALTRAAGTLRTGATALAEHFARQLRP